MSFESAAVSSGTSFKIKKILKLGFRTFYFTFTFYQLFTRPLQSTPHFCLSVEALLLAMLSDLIVSGPSLWVELLLF